MDAIHWFHEHMLSAQSASFKHYNDSTIAGIHLSQSHRTGQKQSRSVYVFQLLLEKSLTLQ